MEHQQQSLSSPSKHLGLEERITVKQFQQLMDVFAHRGTHRHSQGTTHLHRAEFQRALAYVLGRDEEDERVALLSAKMDTEGEGYVRQEEFCSYFLQQLREKDMLSRLYTLPFQEPPRFKHNLYSKETSCRLMAVPNPSRYITVSKDGVIGTWSKGLQLQRGVAMVEDHTHVTTPHRGRRTTLCITDCATMANCCKLAVATTARELAFYDLSTTIYKCQYRIHDLPCVPLCMTYYNPESPASPSYLLYGDEAGAVAVLTFLRPMAGLFQGRGKEEEGTQLIPFNRLSEHCAVMGLQYMAGVHRDWVRRVRYLWHNHSFVSCSSTPTQSLVIRDIERKRRSYVFRVRKGIICFDYSHSLDLLVTGSVDHAVRLWNPYVPSRPAAILMGHISAVQDVLVHRDQGLVFSFSQDAMLCAWDVFEHCLIQTVSVRFPFSQRQPDYGPGILAWLAGNSLTVTCNEYLAEYRVGIPAKPADRWAVTSHAHPLCTALYNPHFHQVVSGCEGSVVNTWDIHSGKRVLRFTKCHGRHEITAMALDSTGRRLLTGSRKGDIRVWNCMSGECLQCMQTPLETEVTGVMHFLEKSRFLTVGWNRRIVTFHDEPDLQEGKIDESQWQGKDHHKDDILCVSYCPPHYLATGSFDGEIVVWNIDTQKVVSRFHSVTKLKPLLLKALRKASLGMSRSSTATSPRSPDASYSSLSTGSTSRPASRRLSTYRIRSNSIHLTHVPVDQLLFLRTRLRGHSCKGSASLVSSEGGRARFWDIFGAHNPIGEFPITEVADENVLALRTDSSDRVLISGDTLGYIAVFPVKDYCSMPLQEASPPGASAKWRAHAGEILSLEYVAHESRPLVLSASGDCTVRLWTLQGHYIGTFGQELPWDLSNPSTFQHPSTPWGEVQRPASALSPMSNGANAAGREGGGEHMPSITVIEEEEEGEEEPNGLAEGLTVLGGEQQLMHSSPYLRASPRKLPQALVDKSLLGQPYQEGLHRRMVGRQERRVHFADINVHSTERFGSLCSPFQALQILKMDDVNYPREQVPPLNQQKS